MPRGTARFAAPLVTRACTIVPIASPQTAFWMFPGWSSDWMVAHPPVQGLLMVGTFVAKTGFFLFVMIWVRWTLPRFRFDQLMELGWKRLLPAALACVTAAAALRVVADYLPS